MTELKDLVHELESGVTGISVRLDTLSDVETLLGQLVDDMNTVIYKGDFCQGYYREHSRMVRVLWELIRYTLGDLSEDYEKVDEIKKGIFNKVVRNNKNSAGTNNN